MRMFSSNGKKIFKWAVYSTLALLSLIFLLFILVRMFPDESLGVVEVLTPEPQKIEITAWERAGSTAFFQTEKSPLKPEFVLSLSDRASLLMNDPSAQIEKEQAQQLITDVDTALTKDLMGYDEAFLLKSRALSAAYEGKELELEKQKLASWIEKKADEARANPEPELVNIDGEELVEKVKLPQNK